MPTTHFTRIAMAIAVLTLAACSTTKLAETADVTGKAVAAAPASPAPAPAPAPAARPSITEPELNAKYVAQLVAECEEAKSYTALIRAAGAFFRSGDRLEAAFLPDAASRRFRKTNAAIALTPPPSRDRTYFVVGLRRLKY